MGTITGYGSKHSHEFKLTVTETATSVENNTSTVSFEFTLYKSSYSWSGWNNIYYTVNINGTDYNGSIPNYTSGQTLQVKIGTQTIPHNTDGTKSINYSFSVTDNSGQSYTCGNASASGSMDLTNIPRTTTVTNSQRSRTSSSISINWATADARDWTQYSLNGGNWTDAEDVVASDNKSGYYTINNLSANTNYTIQTRCRRTGSTTWSYAPSLTIKTYARTIPTISVSNRTSSSITVTSSCNVSVSSTQYRIKKSNGSYGNYQNSATFTGLSANTTYTVEVKKVASESGEAGTSTVNITTYNQTIPTISLSSKTVNSITVTSGCNVAVSSTQYRIKQGSGNYGNYQNGATFSNLSPNTSYTIEVRKVGSESGETGTTTINVTTYAIATINSAPALEHGNSETIQYSNPSGATIAIGIFKTDGNTELCAYRTCSGTNYKFNFTDAELDKIYKLYGLGTSVTVRVYIRTTVNNTNYYNYKEFTITLKGNQKSIKVNVNNVIKRGKIFVNVNGTLKKAVICTNVNNNLKRGI